MAVERAELFEIERLLDKRIVRAQGLAGRGQVRGGHDRGDQVNPIVVQPPQRGIAARGIALEMIAEFLERDGERATLEKCLVAERDPLVDRIVHPDLEEGAEPLAWRRVPARSEERQRDCRAGAGGVELVERLATVINRGEGAGHQAAVGRAATEDHGRRRLWGHGLTSLLRETGRDILHTCRWCPAGR